MHAPTPQVGPTGIPKSSTFRTEHERGTITRYKHWHEIPDELLADPNFGLDNLADESEDFRAQFNVCALGAPPNLPHPVHLHGGDDHGHLRAPAH